MRKLRKDYKITLLTILLILGGCILLANVLLLDLTGKTFFADTDFHKMKGVLISNETVYPQRGTITDSEENILAHDVTVYKIAFILNENHQKYGRNENGELVLVDDYVKDPDLTAAQLAPILGADEDYLRERLSAKDYYQVEVGIYGSNLSYDTKLKIEALNLPGITFESSTSRYYPYNNFASHLIGYVKNQKEEDDSYHLVGISGIEGVFNQELSGTAGYKEYYSDVNGNPLAGGEITIQQASNGYNIKLTLNNIIQQSLEESLQKTMNISDSVDKAWGIVMDAKTGKILGYSSYPGFNPNEMDISDYNDYCATLPYEPGSTIKSFIYSAAIDVGTFNQDDHFDGTTYYVDGNYTNEIHRLNYDNGLGIHNYVDEQIPNATFYEAYCCSYNVGCAVLLEKYIDPQVYMEYMDKFGFFKPVNVYGIDEGNFYGSADYSNPYSIINTSFGQGMSATALQVIQAYTAFTNKGTMIKPYIIDEITDNGGNLIYKGQKTEVGNPISEATATKMLELMSGVVNSGWSITSAKYKIPQVNVGGKSGTAEVALPEGGYGNLTIHSMMIAMPIEDPQVLIYFCYQDSNPRTSQSIPYINELEQKVAQVLGLNDTKQENNIENRTVYQQAMGNYNNHSLAFVEKCIEQFDLQTIIIGDGDTVLRQYPQAGTSLISQQRIMLLTSWNNYTMPDMIGWSRKEVNSFVQLTGIMINMQGNGFVTEQNVEVGTSIDNTTVIELTLQ
ncbi:MAG: penicillin-binding protein [Erysipelotrichia bacterium]|nr:penicillin-binding protein [Erysipelotrichia bacterium]